MKKLPFFISIPHGGKTIPEELKNSICISEKDIFDDIDPFTKEIYDVDNLVEKTEAAEIARTFVDLNRSPEQLPPQFPDGLIKSFTCYNKPIYKTNNAPDSKMTEVLIEKYYYPYHTSIEKAINDPLTKMGFDCHSMAAIGPPVSPDSGKERPLMNLGNVNEKSCDNKTTILLKYCFQEIFNIENDKITINFPFKGGHITRKYGNHPKPWIQIELSRALYLSEPWFDKSTFQINPERLNELNNKFKHVLILFHDKMIEENLQPL